MRKTNTYFLRVISSSEDLAAPVADHLHQHHPTLCPQTIIVAPSQEYSIRHRIPRPIRRYDQRITPERTLVFGDDRLVVIEQHTDGTLDDISIPFEQLVQIEWAMILLYAYVSFTWIADYGLETLKIEYNAVGDEVIRVALEPLRRRQYAPEAAADAPVSTVPDDTMKTLPLKFRNYLRYVLIPGQLARQIIFQPGLQRSPLFWRSRTSEGRILALTSAEMIVIEEAREWLNFGVVIRCFPLRFIQNIRFEPERDRVWLRMRVGTSAVGEDTSLLLSDPNAGCLSDGLQRFAPFIPVEWSREAGPSRVEITR